MLLMAVGENCCRSKAIARSFIAALRSRAAAAAPASRWRCSADACVSLGGPDRGLVQRPRAALRIEPAVALRYEKEASGRNGPKRQVGGDARKAYNAQTPDLAATRASSLIVEVSERRLRGLVPVNAPHGSLVDVTDSRMAIYQLSNVSRSMWVMSAE